MVMAYTPTVYVHFTSCVKFTNGGVPNNRVVSVAWVEWWTELTQTTKRYMGTRERQVCAVMRAVPRVDGVAYVSSVASLGRMAELKDTTARHTVN